MQNNDNEYNNRPKSTVSAEDRNDADQFLASFIPGLLLFIIGGMAAIFWVFCAVITYNYGPIGLLLSPVAFLLTLGAWQGWLGAKNA